MTYPFLSLHSEWCRAAGYAETTIADRRELLTRVASDLGLLHNVTGDQLSSWLGRPGWSAQTRSTYFGHLHGYFLWALRAGHIDTDPMLHLKRPRVPKRAPRPAREESYRRMLRHPDRRWRVATVLAGRAGLRASEIARARRQDIDADDLRVLGKGGRVDVLPTHPDVWRMVSDLPPGPLIRTDNGRTYTPGAISSAYKQAASWLDINLTLHPLRHLYATTLLRQGVNLRIVQQLMRHQSLATTEIYTEVTDQERRLAIHTLPAAA